MKTDKKKGGCRRFGWISEVLALAIVCIGFAAIAEEPAINPVEVKARRVVAYGTNPLKVGSTEITEAMLTKGTTGVTNVTISASAYVTNATLTTYGVSITDTNGVTITALTNVTITLQRAATPTLTLQR